MNLLDLLDDVVGVQWPTGTLEYVLGHTNLGHTFTCRAPGLGLVWVYSKATNRSKLCLEAGLDRGEHGIPDAISRVLRCHGNLRWQVTSQRSVCLYAYDITDLKMSKLQPFSPLSGEKVREARMRGVSLEVSEGSGRRRKRIAIAPPLRPGPSLTLGVTAARR